MYHIPDWEQYYLLDEQYSVSFLCLHISIVWLNYDCPLGIKMATTRTAVLFGKLTCIDSKSNLCWLPV